MSKSKVILFALLLTSMVTGQPGTVAATPVHQLDGPTAQRAQTTLDKMLFLPFAAKSQQSVPGPGSYTISMTLADGGQKATIAFDGLAFLTGNLGADSFFPPGKVADFWGFQYLRDNDPSEMGHNTDFLTRASLNMFTILTSDQKSQLISLAQSQVAAINAYGYKRFVLMTAFRRLLAGDLPPNTDQLDEDAVRAFSGELYRLDGEISYQRAQVMGPILANLNAEQKAYLATMVGQGMTSWPDVPEPPEMNGYGNDVKTAIMTYAGDLFSWYAGNLESDVYFCPERQGTYFGSFYMKDAPAVGNPGYSISTSLTADMGTAFIHALTPAQATLITNLVDDQRASLYGIVDVRTLVATQLRQFMNGQTPLSSTVQSLMQQYGELDGSIVYHYATNFTKVGQTLTETQRAVLQDLRVQTLGTFTPTAAFLYATVISYPVVQNTDFLFSLAPTRSLTVTDMVANMILGRPTATSITVNTLPITATTFYYEYGVTPGVYISHTTPQTTTANLPVETLIDGLAANTRYYYRQRIGSAGAILGAEHTFMTQRAPGATFTFDLQGDSHPERVNQQFSAGLYTRTLLSAASDQPDFYITIGDDFSVDQFVSSTLTANIVAGLYINQRSYLGLVGAPLFLVNGNHEQASLVNLNGPTINANVATWAQTARNAYYPQPAPDAFYSGDTVPVTNVGLLRDYYAFTWGDALFVVIDPYWHSNVVVDNPFGLPQGITYTHASWGITLGEAQYQWFKDTLANSTATYKFVFAHHINGGGRGGIEEAGRWEWGDTSKKFQDNRPGWTKTIHQLMVDNHVTIFFQGHDHIFAHQELDGVVYQTLPEPANPNYSWENQSAFLSGDLYPNSGHVRVTVAPVSVTVSYVRSYLEKPDELAFTYTK